MNNLLIDILLIDAHPRDSQAALETLRALHPAPTVALLDNGHEALRFLKQFPPHENAPRPRLIVFDWDLPHGREALADIASQDRLKCIPLIVWTASSSPQDVLCAYEHFANSYIPKPGNPEEFSAVLHGLVSFWLSTAQLPEP